MARRWAQQPPLIPGVPGLCSLSQLRRVVMVPESCRECRPSVSATMRSCPCTSHCSSWADTSLSTSAKSGSWQGGESAMDQPRGSGHRGCQGSGGTEGFTCTVMLAWISRSVWPWCRMRTLSGTQGDSGHGRGEWTHWTRGLQPLSNPHLCAYRLQAPGTFLPAACPCVPGPSPFPPAPPKSLQTPITNLSFLHTDLLQHPRPPCTGEPQITQHTRYAPLTPAPHTAPTPTLSPSSSPAAHPDPTDPLQLYAAPSGQCLPPLPALSPLAPGSSSPRAMRMKCRLFSVSLSVSMAMPPAPKCSGSIEVRMAPNVSVQGQSREGHSGGHPLGVQGGAGLTCKECPVLEDVPVDLSGGLSPGDEGHSELLPPQQLHVGFGHRPPHPAELWVTEGRAGWWQEGTAHPAGLGRGPVPSALPAALTMPSSGAALFCTGCSNSTLPSASLKRTRLGRPSLRTPRG